MSDYFMKFKAFCIISCGHSTNLFVLLSLSLSTTYFFSFVVYLLHCVVLLVCNITTTIYSDLLYALFALFDTPCDILE